MTEKHVCAISLTAIGLPAVCLGLCRLLWAGVPDAVVRALGIVILIALPVLAFSTVRLSAKNKKK